MQKRTFSTGTTYYFHVTNGRKYLDEIGKVFPSHQEAMAYATVVAGELAQDGDWDGFVVSVTDENGGIIARVPVGKFKCILHRCCWSIAPILWQMKNIAND
jgi:hypothetical protein